uniref:Secreted protein n=1 Tax=Rhipicephalus appendiculatus TaxID=34631 RepID=A0A131YEB0_RHIAP
MLSISIALFMLCKASMPISVEKPLTNTVAASCVLQFVVSLTTIHQYQWRSQGGGRLKPPPPKIFSFACVYTHAHIQRTHEHT